MGKPTTQAVLTTQAARDGARETMDLSLFKADGTPVDLEAELAKIPSVAVGTSLGTTGTVALNFATLAGTKQLIAATGNITFTTSNLAAGRTVRLFIDAGASGRTITYPSWIAQSIALPTTIPSGKRLALTLESLGTTDANVSATAALQP